jgi:phosphate uptake regulator
VGNIKRKVIQIAGSTCLISLPKEWITKHNIKKGAELELQEQGNKVVVSTDSMPELEAKVIDITGMDRSNIIFSLRGAYRKGYDEIELQYNNPYTVHLRTGEKQKVSAIIRDEISRLVGFEIIQQKENSCTLKSLSQASAKDFTNILRRIFLLLNDAFTDIMNGISTGNVALLETMEEKRYNITTFISYSFRLLNKRGGDIAVDPKGHFEVISSLEEITNILKWIARDAISLKRTKFTPKGKDIMEKVASGFKMYYDLFYKFDKDKIIRMYENRHDALDMLKSNMKKLPAEEVVILTRACYIFDILVRMTFSKSYES